MRMRNATAASKTRLVGYARVSTEEQHTDPQADELRAAGCALVHAEHASGADRDRPVLARVLRDIRPGETLVVVRLDRLARSVAHLLSVIEQLEAKGAHFRSLRDPIDTTTPQGMFSLQVLGAVAQLERALIAERTKAGLRSAKARGRVGGNPGLRARDPGTIRKLRSARDAVTLMPCLPGSMPGCRQCDGCVPTSPGAMWCRCSTAAAVARHGPPSACAGRCTDWPAKASSTRLARESTTQASR